MTRSTKSGKTTVVTLASNRPDFIPLQLQGFATHLSGEWEFVVLNNATDRKLRREISATCSALNLREIQVGVDLALGLKGGELALRPWGYANPNLACSYGLNWFWKHQLSNLNSEYLILIDSDMFLVADCDPQEILRGYDFAFVPQFRGENLEVYYPWNGLVFIRTQMKNSESLNWHPGAVLGHPCDVGGQSHHWLKQNRSEIRIRHLTALTVYGVDTTSEPSRYHVAVNGNWNSHLSFTDGGARWEFDLFKGETPRPDSWKTIQSGTDYEVSSPILARHLRNLIELAENSDFPDPWYFDLIGVKGTEGRFEGFVFHYKSGSNYQPWATDLYNRKKSDALLALLSDPGSCLRG